MNLHHKQFRSLQNSENGEVSGDTLFLYQQNGDIISATYQGGSILQGQLLGKMFDDDHIEFVYQHLNTDMELMTGKCRSYPELNEHGKIILREFWQWTCKDHSKGESTIVEV